MPIQFILGRSGSGKTHHCLEAIRAELRRRPTGPALILLVPEQATFQMEQALLADDSLEGFHRAHVMSFVRLARHILFETAPPTLPPLSETARHMILRRILQTNRDALTIFSRIGRRTGFIHHLAATIGEFRQYQITPAQLRAQSARLAGDPDPAQRPLSEKLTDLALIYQGYLDHVTDRFIDPDDLLDLVAVNCADAPFLTGAQLWIDGFAGFTPQQFTVVQSLMTRADSTYITLCLDPHHPQFQRAADHPDDDAALDEIHLFHPLLQTYQQLRRRIAAAALPVSSPLLLPATEPPTLPRFHLSSPLAQLEKNFLTAHPTTAVPAPAADTPLPDTDIVIVEAATRRREVDALARHILHLCRDRNYRFREIAVILRDFGPYRELIEASFADHDIPYFLDQRRPVRHHPLVELLRSAIHLIADNFKTQDVFTYLKTDLVPLPPLDTTAARTVIDALENYTRAHAITSTHWRNETPWPTSDTSALPDDLTPAALDHYRTIALQPLLNFSQNLHQSNYDPEQTFTVRTLTTELANLLEAIDVRQTLSDWCRSAEAAGQLDLAHIHQTLWSDITALLDDLVASLGDTELTLTEYAEILTASLAQLTLGLTPPALEQVLVGTIERSRHPRIRAAFVLGVNDGAFPRVSAPDAIFTDDQRNHLARTGLHLAPAAAQRLFHERYLAYIAFTRPQEFLWVSYPIADEMGAALNPSSLIDDLTAAVPTAPRHCLPDDTAAPDPDRITNLAQLNAELAFALADPLITDPTWPQLYQYARTQPAYAPTLALGLAGLTYHNRAALDPALIPNLFASDLTTSISHLESFAACPFQHFARHVLALRPRDELKLGAIDLGNFYHAVLRRIFLQSRAADLTWSQLTPEKLTTFLDTAVDQLRRSPQFERLFTQSQRNAFLLNEARRHLHRFCLSLISAARAGTFQQTAAELSFGPDADLPALTLELSAGRTLHLRGIIDRIDTATQDSTLGLIVYDYKSTARPFPFAQFYHGLALQLLSYLLVLTEHYQSPNQPVAALYLPITHRPQSQTGPPPDHILQADRQSAAPADEARKAIGLINGDWTTALDATVPTPGSSKHFSIYINKDGSPYNGRSSGLLTPDQMSALLAHCRTKLTDLAAGLLDGRIDVAPYRLNRQSPCPHCRYRAVCRFDPRCDNYRTLEDLDRPAVLNKIT